MNCLLFERKKERTDYNEKKNDYYEKHKKITVLFYDSVCNRIFRMRFRSAGAVFRQRLRTE